MLIFVSTANATFPGSNGRVAFEQDGDILMQGVSESSPTNLNKSLGVSEGSPSWSPNGTLVTYVADGDVWIANSDGSSAHKMLDDGTSPSFSADGSQLVFVRSTNIYKVNTDGSSVTQLTDSGTSSDSRPRWSPDGSKILFSRTDGSKYDSSVSVYKTDTYVMNADGSSLTNLTNAGTYSSSGSGGSGSSAYTYTTKYYPKYQYPDWSPDGARIIYTYYRYSSTTKVTTSSGSTSNSTSYVSYVYISSSDGSSPTKVSTSCNYNYNPVFSPDGYYMAWVGDGCGTSGADGVFVATDAETSAPQQLSDETNAPDWQPSAGANIAVSTESPTVAVGEQAKFKVTVANSGSLAFGNALTGVLPDGLSFVSASPSTGSVASDSLTWSVGKLGSNESATVDVVANTSKAGTLTVPLSVTSWGSDLDTSNNTATATVTVTDATVETQSVTDSTKPTAKLVLPKCKRNGRTLKGLKCKRFRYARKRWKTIKATAFDNSALSKVQFQVIRELGKKKAKKSKSSSKRCRVQVTIKKSKKMACSKAEKVWIKGSSANASQKKSGITHVLKLNRKLRKGTYKIRVRAVDATGNKSKVTGANKRSVRLR